jgi:hypothetical protein
MNFTGADFYALCSDALLAAYKRKTDAIDALVAARNFFDSAPMSPALAAPSPAPVRRPATTRTVLAEMTEDELKGTVCFFPYLPVDFLLFLFVFVC